MEQKFIIREAKLSDIKHVALLFDQYRVFYKKESDIEAAIIFLSERLASNESILFIAEKADQNIVGFTQLYPSFSSTRMKRLWILNDLFVSETHRGKGISKSLLNKAKEWCIVTDGCGVILETDKSNTIGNKLYPSVGFNQDEEHNYYSWDNDLEKSLN